jgi:Zn-dependent protease/CBS domain-containing protein
MFSGFRIGKLFGIDIRIAWSWLLIFALVTWSLGIAFGGFHPNWGPVLQWGLAAAASLLFFGSVLAHELAHSLVAKAEGIPVRSITLILFGGVSNIREEPHSPGNEFLMAIVGPLTSIVIGIVLTVAVSLAAGQATRGSVTNAISQLGPAATIFAWVGSINIILGIFNLVPGFPLDGGRVLRSIAWAISGNLRQATWVAAGAGHLIAWAMIGVGIAMAFGIQIPILGTGLFSGLWLAFIGWFLNSAAAQSYQQVVIRDVLEGVPVARLMHECPPTVPPSISVDELVHDHVMQTEEHAFPVVADGHLAGIVTLQDIRRIPRDQWQSTTVREIMTPADQVETVTANEDAEQAFGKLTSRDVGQLPVMEDGTVTGCLSRRDIVRWLRLDSDQNPGLGSRRGPPPGPDGSGR